MGVLGKMAGGKNAQTWDDANVCPGDSRLRLIFAPPTACRGTKQKESRECSEEKWQGRFTHIIAPETEPSWAMEDTFALMLAL